MDRDTYLEGGNTFVCSIKNVTFCDKGKAVHTGKSGNYVTHRIHLVLLYNSCLTKDVPVLNKNLRKKSDNLWLIIIPQLTIIYIYTCNDTDHKNSSSVTFLT